MTEGGTVLIFISVIIFIGICIWSMSSTLVEVKSRGDDLGIFDIDKIPLPPNNDLGYLVVGYSQAGSPHGVDKQFDEFHKAIKHIKSRLNKSSMFSVRAYHNKEKHTFEYHRSFYDGRGAREGRKLNEITIFYSKPDANLQSYNDARADGLSIKEANEIYESGVIYKREVKLKQVVELTKVEDKPNLESDIVIEFVGAAKNKNLITKLEDDKIYIAELVIEDSNINVKINGDQIARVSARTKNKTAKFIENIGCYVKVLVWVNGENLAINMLCHRGDNTVNENYNK